MRVDSVREEKSGAFPNGPSHIDKDGFLKILVAQLKYQNPLQPIKPYEFISQLSQLTQVEQLENIERSVDALREAMEVLNIGSLASLLGKRVSTRSQVMTKGDELYVKPDEEYERVIISITDLKTGEKREVKMEKGDPLVFRHEGENPIYVSAYAVKGNRIIFCQIDLFRVVKGIELGENGKARLLFEDGLTTSLKEVKSLKD